MKVLENGIYRDMTEAEILEIENEYTPEMRIAFLKQQLSDSDYKAIKYAEGLIGEADYQPIKAQRQAWREEINKLEGDI